MANISSFSDIELLIASARREFKEKSEQQIKKLGEIFDLYFDFSGSIAKFRASNGWLGSREEDFFKAETKALRNVLAMFVLSESGMFDAALVHKRNYCEILAIAIAIGYSPSLWARWKKNALGNFHEILKRLEESTEVPPLEKQLLPALRKYWIEGSSKFSHEIARDNLQSIGDAKKLKIGVSIATPDFQDRRLNTLINMANNPLQLLVEVFKYVEFTSQNPKEFPEAIPLICRFNALTKELSNTERLTA